MASAALKRTTVSIEGYLELERESPVRHEYVGGQVYAMGGSSDRHNLVAGTLFNALFNHIAGRCQVYMADMRLRIALADGEVGYYPDVLVACDPADRASHHRERPVFLAEVLSPTTERVDRTEKLIAYRQIPSLEEYLIAEQDVARVELYRRSNGFEREVLEAGDVIRFASVGLELTVEQLYRHVAF